MKIRVLPIVMFFAFISITVKLFDHILNKDFNITTASQDIALASEGEKSGDKKKEEPKHELGGADPNAEWSPGPHLGPEKIVPDNSNGMEENILENLADRRKELDKWSESISMKENILNATEKKINRKMDELHSLKDEVEAILKEYQDKENRKITRLVKIYENMKPQDAAKIFDAMDMDILLEVIDNMKEAKAAPILAKMDYLKAKEVTTQLATRRSLSDKSN